MRTATVAEVKAKLSAYIAETAGGPVIVTRHGRPTAILVRAPEDPEDLERFLLAMSPLFQRIVHEASRAAGIPHDEFWSRMEAREVPEAGPRKHARRARGGRSRKAR